MKRARALRISLWGVGVIGAGIVLGLIVAAIGYDNALDRAWMSLMASARVEPLLTFAYVLDWVGGGWRAVAAVPLIVLAVLALMRRWWGMVFLVTASLFSVALVQMLKSLFARARPEDILVHSDFGSFPSGHVTNATTLMVVLILLIRKTWMTAVGVIWIIAMALSRTYLGAHWLTDTIAGIAIGTGAALAMWGAFSTQLEREELGRHPSSL